MTDDLDLGPDLDLDWARELFAGTRGAAEPGWIPDSAAWARAGDRRRRLRTAGAGGGLAGVVAVTAAVFLSLGAGTTGAGAPAAPGGAWAGRPLSDVFRYAQLESFAAPPGDDGAGYVPAPAMADLATVLGRLDPALTHLTGGSGRPPAPHIVAAGDSRVGHRGPISLSSVWTTDQTRSSGSLTFIFASSGAQSEHMPFIEPGGDQLGAPCGTAFARSAPSGTAPVTTQSPVRWSACAVSHLPDGSTIGRASAPSGTGTVAVAVREFSDGEFFAIVAQDFHASAMWPDTPPDPADVVKPAPWTGQSLAAALADPGVRSGWSR